MASRSPVPADVLEGFPDLTGSLLEGRYRVGEALGVGGMGAVFKAEHVRLHRKVALKVMRPVYMQYRHHVARFLKEARAASQVKHPNVVEILDVGQTPNGTVYTVMELLEGEDLATLLRCEGRLPWPRAYEILLQVVGAVEAAHEQGVIHRDVKPANCILIRGKNDTLVVKMVDFGIAKFHDTLLSDDDPLTKTGEVIGTPAYMAPELSLGRPANARTDIYSVGVLAYQMLTGERPFSGATAVQMHLNQTTRPPIPPRRLEPSIPEGVQALILAALSVDPEDRPASMAQVGQSLRALAPRSRPTLPMTGEFPRPLVPSGPHFKSVGASRDITITEDPLAPYDTTLPGTSAGPPPSPPPSQSPRPLQPQTTAPAAPEPSPVPSEEEDDWADVETRLVDAADPPTYSEDDNWDDIKTRLVESGPLKMAEPVPDTLDQIETVPLDPDAVRASMRGDTQRAPPPARTMGTEPGAFVGHVRTLVADPEQSRLQSMSSGPRSGAGAFVGRVRTLVADPEQSRLQSMQGGAAGSSPVNKMTLVKGSSAPVLEPIGSEPSSWASTMRRPATPKSAVPVPRRASPSGMVGEAAVPTASGSPWAVMVLSVVLAVAAAVGIWWWWPEIKAWLGG
ncbi:MAG: protein kinase [Myxococcota bacterium]